MARELVQMLWCDVHMQRSDDEREPAEGEYELVVDGQKRTIALCKTCMEMSLSFQEVLALVVQYGLSDKQLGRPEQPSSAPATRRGRGNFSRTQVPETCPVEDCTRDEPFKDWNAFRAHLRDRHSLTPGDLDGSEPSILCPLPDAHGLPGVACEAVVAGVRGSTTHLRTMHPDQYTSIRDGSVKGVREWYRTVAVEQGKLAPTG